MKPNWNPFVFTLLITSGTSPTAALSIPRPARALLSTQPSPGQSYQHPLAWAPSHDGNDDDIDIITGSQFYGLRTFSNVPYVNCLSDEGEGKYDIAVLGAPFDTSTTGRPGARFGPTGIRIGSQRQFASVDVYSGENILEDWATVVDCGDVAITRLDNTIAFKQLDKAHRIISGRVASNSSVSKTPRILTLGGDHATTLSALRSTFQRWGQVSVIHFDSHIDTWNPDVLGGDISDYAGINHGTFLHIAHEEGLILPTSLHAGIRAPLIHHNDTRNDLRCGFSTITARALDRLGTAGVITQIRERVGSSKVYISVDIDVLDPAFAPATGTAEPGGWSTRELLTILDGLRGLAVVGADVVEVAPVYDGVGETTVLAAAAVGFSLVGLMVGMPVRSLADGPVS